VRRSNGPEGIAMNKDQIVSAVRESARIDTRERAEKAVRATLRVLGQRLAERRQTWLRSSHLNWLKSC
jgi:uncharacterized protein (DUF2267 family)